MSHVLLLEDTEEINGVWQQQTWYHFPPRDNDRGRADSVTSSRPSRSWIDDRSIEFDSSSRDFGQFPWVKMWGINRDPHEYRVQKKFFGLSDIRSFNWAKVQSSFLNFPQNILGLIFTKNGQVPFYNGSEWFSKLFIEYLRDLHQSWLFVAKCDQLRSYNDQEQFKKLYIKYWENNFVTVNYSLQKAVSFHFTTVQNILQNFPSNIQALLSSQFIIRCKKRWTSIMIWCSTEWLHKENKLLNIRHLFVIDTLQLIYRNN